jgi:hypothetical protein
MLCREEKQCALNARIIKNGPQNENQRIATPFFSSLLEPLPRKVCQLANPTDTRKRCLPAVDW